MKNMKLISHLLIGVRCDIGSMKVQRRHRHGEQSRKKDKYRPEIDSCSETLFLHGNAGQADS